MDRKLVNLRTTIFCHTVQMPEDDTLKLRQIDRARAEMDAITDELEFIKAQLARLPTRKDLARMALSIMFCTATLVVVGIKAFAG
jgi:hypothetical protein